MTAHFFQSWSAWLARTPGRLGRFLGVMLGLFAGMSLHMRTGEPSAANDMLMAQALVPLAAAFAFWVFTSSRRAKSFGLYLVGGWFGGLVVVPLLIVLLTSWITGTPPFRFF